MDEDDGKEGLVLAALAGICLFISVAYAIALFVQTVVL